MYKPKLVIIGGGVGGLNLAVSSSSFLDVTVIDKKDFFEWNPANVRSVVDTTLLEKVEMPYKDMKNIGTFVQGSVVKLEENSVVLADGTILPFDYAVIATGSLYSDPIGRSTEVSIKERKAEIQALATKVKRAEEVLIVGGGPTGVELAAEILEAFPTKKVTLVQSGSQLLPAKSAAMGDKALKFLKKQGAKVILGERISKVEGLTTEFVTSSGTKLTAQAVFWTIAGRPNTQWLKETAPQLLDEKGQVKVDEYLRVEGLPNVFALGDVTNTLEHKMAYYAGESAKVLAKNLRVLSKAGRPAKLKPWKPNGGMEAQFVSLGRKAGVGHLGSVNLPSFMVVFAKSKDLFVSQCRKLLGLPA